MRGHDIYTSLNRHPVPCTRLIVSLPLDGVPAGFDMSGRFKIAEVGQSFEFQSANSSPFPAAGYGQSSWSSRLPVL